MSKKLTKPTNNGRPRAGRIVDKKKKPFTIRKEVYNTDARYILWRMEVLKAQGLYRKTMFGIEIIWGGTKYHFPDPEQRESNKNMFIFAMVKRDALAYVAKRKIRPSKPLPAILKNEKVKRRGREVWPADMDDAFWTIAYKLKIINNNTYSRGLLLGKKICNAALASLGSDKSYNNIRKGQITPDKERWRGAQDLKLVYAKIRNRCFRYMLELAEILGSGFVEYKTDCMYYIRTNRNIEKVRKFMEKNNLYYKGGVNPPQERKSRLK